MSLSSRYNTELLAPAGSVEAFMAAMEAGADAVYCGLKDFSARAKAKNFTLGEIENLSAYAHKLGRKLYIPLNTLIQEAELPRLIEVLEGIVACRIDGLIIQDLGVYHLVQQHFPEIPLHASTQMAVHNRAGVQMLERLGFERGVLARELSLDEITAIRQGTTLELEHFIHGALCYSISGHCLFSSFQTGQSGNRGACAQPCRRRYSQDNKPQFTFSTSDFSTLSHLPQLAASGVMSFKIEGRMKNSEYVWNVVRAYRGVLDCPEADLSAAIRRGEVILQEAHGRQTSDGFLRGQRTTILLPNQKGGIGTPVGQIEQAKGKSISFTSSIPLHIGDRLRVQPKTDQPGTAFTIRHLKSTKPKGQQAGIITLQTPFFERFNPGDHIFKVGSGRGFTLSEEGCRRRLTTARHTPSQIALNISCTANSLRVTATSPLDFQHTYEVETYPAQKSPLSLSTLENIFKKTAQPELQLATIQATDLPAVVIKPSRLKAIRRDFYGKLNKELHTLQEKKAAKRRTRIHLELAPNSSAVQSNPPQRYVLTEQPHADLLAHPDLKLILPLATSLDHADHAYIWDIPAIIYGKAWQEIEELVQQKLALGYGKFRLNNIGHFRLFAEADNTQLMAGPALYCLNHQAMRCLHKLGIKQITTSLEDDRTNINALCAHTNQAIVQIYGNITLMTSRIPLSVTATIHSQTERLHPIHDNELTHIQPDTPFCLSGHLQELQAMGAGGYLIDLRDHTDQQRQAILTAIDRDQPLDQTTLFNYQRGLI